MGNITLPVPGVTPGPEWASTLNQAITDVNTTASAAVPNTPEGRQALADSSELTATFVAVRTSDGHTLPPSTIVVITLDKTLAEVTATPVADIADITFEEV